MILMIGSAAFVGLVHSLSPGHWLPVVLMVKTRRWSFRKAVFGALVASSGHIVVSLGISAFAIIVGAHFLSSYEGIIEKYAGLMLAAFGVAYAAYAYFRHSSCHGHTHHGPDPRKSEKEGKGPYLFLFSLGLSPCVAVLPVLIAASAISRSALVFSMMAFSFGVLGAFLGATLLVSLGLVKLDHPIFEHYGDVITGMGVAIMGTILFCIAS